MILQLRVPLHAPHRFPGIARGRVALIQLCQHFAKVGYVGVSPGLPLTLKEVTNQAFSSTLRLYFVQIGLLLCALPPIGHIVPPQIL